LLHIPDADVEVSLNHARACNLHHGISYAVGDRLAARASSRATAHSTDPDRERSVTLAAWHEGEENGVVEQRMTDMETRLRKLEREFQSLHIEQSAHNIVMTQVLARLARDRTLHFPINAAFEQALDVAQTLAVSPTKGIAPEHGVNVLQIIEEIRSTVLGRSG
jgi:hypothetical protein